MGHRPLAPAPPYTLDALLNNGSGVFTPTQSVTASHYNPIAAGDLNADGKLDLVIPDFDSNTFSVYEGNGAGSFTLQKTFATIFAPDTAYVTDFDGDGNPDILIGIASEGFFGPDNSGTGEILLGTGSFNFSSPAELVAQSSSVSLENGEHAFAVADLNGDGKPDLAVASTAGTTTAPGLASVTLYTNNGSGGFNAPATVNFTIDGSSLRTETRSWPFPSVAPRPSIWFAQA